MDREAQGMNMTVAEWRGALRDAGEAIGRLLSADPAVHAVFLTGSILGPSFDELSDVDLVCICHAGVAADFSRRLSALLEQYAPITRMLWQPNVDTLGVTFANGVHADIGLKTDLTRVDCPQLEALFDPDGLLASYVPANSSLPLAEVVRGFEHMAAILSDLEKAAHRGEFVHVSTLLSRLLHSSVIVYRHAFDRPRSLYGSKQLVALLDEDQRRAWADALASVSCATYREGAIALVRLTLDTLPSFPPAERALFNDAFLRESLARFERRVVTRSAP